MRIDKIILYSFKLNKEDNIGFIKVPDKANKEKTILMKTITLLPYFRET